MPSVSERFSVPIIRTRCMEFLTGNFRKAMIGRQTNTHGPRSATLHFPQDSSLPCLLALPDFSSPSWTALLSGAIFHRHLWSSLHLGGWRWNLLSIHQSVLHVRRRGKTEPSISNHSQLFIASLLRVSCTSFSLRFLLLLLPHCSSWYIYSISGVSIEIDR